eukprot:2837831-Amphidinium_carterae.1
MDAPPLGAPSMLACWLKRIPGRHGGVCVCVFHTSWHSPLSLQRPAELGAGCSSAGNMPGEM